MTPAKEATFILLGNAGTETAAIAQQLGIAVGLARSRAYALQQHLLPLEGSQSYRGENPDTLGMERRSGDLPVGRCMWHRAKRVSRHFEGEEGAWARRT
jgi:hypothetical protein